MIFVQSVEMKPLQKGLEVETYKAFIQGNGAGKTMRRACYSASCADAGVGEHHNWVLEANMEYRREDGTTVIGTTNAVSLFDFPLDISFTGTSDTFWTGFPESWAILNIGGAQFNCSHHTSNAGGATGYFGLGNEVGTKAVNQTTGSRACNLDRKILCVEQKR